MKKRLIFIALVLAALLLVGYRYSIVEQNDPLPDDVRLTMNRWFGAALAETEPPVSLFPASPTPTPAPTPEPTPVPTPVPTPEPRLERGDSGEEVRAMQKRLRELGFLTGTADGKFGPQTEQAVIRFKEHLYDLYAEHAERERAAMAEAPAESARPDAAADEAAPDAHLTAGTDPVKPEPSPEAGSEEAALPASLESAGVESALPAANEAVMPDNPPQTPAAQPVPEPVFDGRADEETYRLLVEKGFDEYQALLSGGSRGAEVVRLQERLRMLGYLKGRADGVFGRQTTQAVTAFQRRNKLTQDGIAGERTQRLLFSGAALRQIVRPPQPYLLKISTEKQRVYAYEWSDADAAYTRLARTMVCSTGLPETPTPKGTYKNTSPVVTWGYFPKYDVWAQYLYRIQGPYLFHSVLYDEADESTVKWGSVNKLGSPASHGCIRLSVEDAGWIYKNCPAGTTVTVY